MDNKQEEKIKVLLVDDENLIRSLFADAFQIYGGSVNFEIEVANGPEEFRKKLFDYQPDIILLDLIMPVKGGDGAEELSEEAGFTLLREVKENEKFKNTPVIVFSNLGDISAKEKAESFGADAYMVKSETLPDDLIKTIKKLLNLN